MGAAAVRRGRRQWKGGDSVGQRRRSSGGGRRAAEAASRNGRGCGRQRAKRSLLSSPARALSPNFRSLFLADAADAAAPAGSPTCYGTSNKWSTYPRRRPDRPPRHPSPLRHAYYMNANANANALRVHSHRHVAQNVEISCLEEKRLYISPIARSPRPTVRRVDFCCSPRNPPYFQ